MTAFSANPFIYVFSAIAVAVAVLYFSYLAIDRIGLETRSTVATVTDKQFNASGTTYNSTVAGGRTWVQSHDTPVRCVLVTGVLRKALIDAQRISGVPILTKPLDFRRLQRIISEPPS